MQAILNIIRYPLQNNVTKQIMYVLRTKIGASCHITYLSFYFL